MGKRKELAQGKKTIHSRFVFSLKLDIKKLLQLKEIETEARFWLFAITLANFRL